MYKYQQLSDELKQVGQSFQRDREVSEGYCAQDIEANQLAIKLAHKLTESLEISSDSASDRLYEILANALLNESNETIFFLSDNVGRKKFGTRSR